MKFSGWNYREPIKKGGKYKFLYLAIKIFGSESPHENRYISFQELTFIQETVEKMCDLKPLREWPLKEILTSKSVIVNIFANILSDFTFYGIYSVLPLYLEETFNFNFIVCICSKYCNCSNSKSFSFRLENMLFCIQFNFILKWFIVFTFF